MAASKGGALKYKRVCGYVRNNIKAINKNVAIIQKLVDKLGTLEDKSQLQSKLQQTEQATQRLTKETHSFLKQLHHCFGDLPSDRHQSKIMQVKKLEENFSTALNSFQKVWVQVPVAAEKEKESVSQARSMSKEQGDMIDRIEANVDGPGGNVDVETAMVQLYKASQYQKAARRKCCIPVLVIIVVATAALSPIIYVSVRK